MTDPAEELILDDGDGPPGDLAADVLLRFSQLVHPITVISDLSTPKIPA